VTLFCPAKVQQIDSSKALQRVTLTDGRTLEAKLVVGADGGASDVAAQMKLDSNTLDFGQSAIIANVQCNHPHQSRAFERFTEHGPVALLPMQDNRWSLVWCVSHEQVEPLRQCTDEAFLTRLQTMFGYRVGRFEVVGKRDIYPLVLTTRCALFSHRSVIIGNAAHSLHPIAGQGFNLGIRDAATLAQLLKDTEDPGDFALLNRYRMMRREDIATTVGLTSALAIGFSSRDKLSVVARNAALAALAKIPVLKTSLVRQTLGMLEVENNESHFTH
jgi:2-octaprenyl-6-methoxyphenol hydroxylase